MVVGSQTNMNEEEHSGQELKAATQKGRMQYVLLLSTKGVDKIKTGEGSARRRGVKVDLPRKLVDKFNHQTL